MVLLAFQPFIKGFGLKAVFYWDTLNRLVPLHQGPTKLSNSTAQKEEEKEKEREGKSRQKGKGGGVLRQLVAAQKNLTIWLFFFLVKNKNSS